MGFENSDPPEPRTFVAFLALAVVCAIVLLAVGMICTLIH